MFWHITIAVNYILPSFYLVPYICPLFTQHYSIQARGKCSLVEGDTFPKSDYRSVPDKLVNCSFRATKGTSEDCNAYIKKNRIYGNYLSTHIFLLITAVENALGFPIH